jgi:hypothetical protein
MLTSSTVTKEILPTPKDSTSQPMHIWQCLPEHGLWGTKFTLRLTSVSSVIFEMLSPNLGFFKRRHTLKTPN